MPMYQYVEDEGYTRAIYARTLDEAIGKAQCVLRYRGYHRRPFAPGWITARLIAETDDDRPAKPLTVAVWLEED